MGYVKPSLARRNSAVEKLVERLLPAGSAGIVRNEGTVINPEVIESMVGLCRLELQTSTVSR
jgi:hypothetical protein